MSPARRGVRRLVPTRIVGLAGTAVERREAGTGSAWLAGATVRIDPRAAGLHGWFKLQIGAPGAVPRLVTISATDADGRTVVRRLRTQGWIRRTNVFLGPAARTVEIDMVAELGRVPEPRLLCARRLGLAEFLLRLRRVLGPRRIPAAVRFYTDPGSLLLESWTLDGLFLERQRDAGYRDWVAREEQSELGALVAGLAQPPPLPAIAFVVLAGETGAAPLEAALAALRRQTSDRWRLYIAGAAAPQVLAGALGGEGAGPEAQIRLLESEPGGGRAAAFNAALERIDEPYVCRLDGDVLLAPRAVEILTATLAGAPDTAIAFADEDRIDDRGRRHSPAFKPAFSRELFYAHSYLGRLAVLSTARLRAAGGMRPELEGALDTDLLLRVLEDAGDQAVRHVAAVLCHVRGPEGDPGPPGALGDEDRDVRALALREHFARLGVSAEVGLLNGGFHHVRYRPVAHPLVSILIPSAGRAHLLGPCLRSVFERTRYPAFEVVLIDHDVREPAGRALLDGYASRANVRLCTFRGPFNFSAMINSGAAAAAGELLLLLNDDTEVISPEWLDELVAVAVQPGVGCVGAKLLFEDETIQHCGVAVGGPATPRHAFLGAPDGVPGPFGRLLVPSSYAAVTGACLMISRALFAEVGGLAEELAVAFNDIDLCLAALRRGRRNIVVPAARLYHYESVSRGHLDSPASFARERAEKDVFWRRNPGREAGDPLFPPHWIRFYETAMK